MFLPIILQIIYFKVFRGKKLIKDTKKDVLWNIKKHELKVEIVLNSKKDSDCCSDEASTTDESEAQIRFIPEDRFQKITDAVLKTADSSIEKISASKKS